jgi:hypothetical protein
MQKIFFDIPYIFSCTGFTITDGMQNVTGHEGKTWQRKGNVVFVGAIMVVQSDAFATWNQLIGRHLLKVCFE